MKNKRLSSVGFVIVATAFMLAGCQLYFGDKGNGGGSGGPITGGPGGTSGPGFKCNGDAQCAAGCFCADGTCTEGGFCNGTTDCGPGFACDTSRSSCKPITCPLPCPFADVCVDGKGCVPDPAGTCLGTITCTDAAPACPVGQVALRKDGCFTKQCRAITACEAPPLCSSLTHEADCTARSADCSALTLGRDCHHSDGTDCHTGDTDCVCNQISFLSCEVKGSVTNPMIIGD